MLKQVNWSTAGWRWKTRSHADFQLPCIFLVRPKWYKRPGFPFHPAAPFAYLERENMLIVSNRMHTSCIWPRNLPILEICEILPDVQMHVRLVSSDYNLFTKKTSPFPKIFKKPKSTRKSFQKNWVISMRLGRPVHRVWRRGGNTIKLMISPPPLCPTNLLSLQCVFLVKFIPAITKKQHDSSGP